MALKPGIFLNKKEFFARMDLLVKHVKAIPLADGFDEILMPGEKEARLAACRLKSGIPYATSDLLALEKLALANKVHPLSYSN